MKEYIEELRAYAYTTEPNSSETMQRQVSLMELKLACFGTEIVGL